MKSNTTYYPPKSPIEDLGDGSYYYNFNINEKVMLDEDSKETYLSYDYDQVRLKFPVDVDNVQLAVKTVTLNHKVNKIAIESVNNLSNRTKTYKGSESNLTKINLKTDIDDIIIDTPIKKGE